MRLSKGGGKSACTSEFSVTHCHLTAALRYSGAITRASSRWRFDVATIVASIRFSQCGSTIWRASQCNAGCSQRATPTIPGTRNAMCCVSFMLSTTEIHNLHSSELPNDNIDSCAILCTLLIHACPSIRRSSSSAAKKDRSCRCRGGSGDGQETHALANTLLPTKANISLPDRSY